jgi:hypothetical protein
MGEMFVGEDEGGGMGMGGMGGGFQKDAGLYDY